MDSMKSFDELKKELLQKAKEKGACSTGYELAKNATTEKELLKVIHDHISWYIKNKIISNEYLSNFSAEPLLASGIANTGFENTGISNSGDSNSGDRNSGYRNSGDRNSGNWNSGDRNSGDRNSGDSNSGYWNSGDRNSGNWNSGDRNSGDSNSGYRNSGAFCTDNNPNVWLFDQPTDMTVREWEQSRAYSVMGNLNPTIWIWSNEMTEQEKKDHITHETTGGFLKTIPLKEAWLNLWGNLSQSDKNSFISLPNFNADKFLEITGITV